MQALPMHCRRDSALTPRRYPLSTSPVARCAVLQSALIGECRAVWLDPRPAAAELSVIYPRSYYAYNRSQKVTPIVGKAKAALDRIKFNSFLRRTGIPGLLS